MKTMDISDVATRSGMTPSALRYYEELKLIESAWRNGLRRQYEANVIPRLAFIAMGQTAGFTLREIGPMLDGKGVRVEREQIRSKASDLENNAKEMFALASIMLHVAECPAPSHMECPTFRRLLNVGLKRHARSLRNRRSSKGRLA